MGLAGKINHWAEPFPLLCLDFVQYMRRTTPLLRLDYIWILKSTPGISERPLICTTRHMPGYRKDAKPSICIWSKYLNITMHFMPEIGQFPLICC